MSLIPPQSHIKWFTAKLLHTSCGHITIFTNLDPEFHNNNNSSSSNSEEQEGNNDNPCIDIKTLYEVKYNIPKCDRCWLVEEFNLSWEDAVGEANEGLTSEVLGLPPVCGHFQDTEQILESHVIAERILKFQEYEDEQEREFKMRKMEMLHRSIIRPVIGTPREDKCNICFGDWKCETAEVEKPVTLPCKHEFGEKCILEWLLEHKSCPECRREF